MWMTLPSYHFQWLRWLQSSCPKGEFIRIRIHSNPRIHQYTPTRIKYVRYADDWIVGVDGSKIDAIEVKTKIKDFLKNSLQLTLNMEKTKITHLKTSKAVRIGYEIRVDPSVKITKVTKKINPGRITYLKRTTGQLLGFRAPIKLLLNKLQKRGFCDQKKFPTSKNVWTIYEDHVIVSSYNSILRGILGYYSGAHNQSFTRITNPLQEYIILYKNI
jgi:hypothetical protein